MTNHLVTSLGRSSSIPPRHVLQWLQLDLFAVAEAARGRKLGSRARAARQSGSLRTVGGRRGCGALPDGNHGENL